MQSISQQNMLLLKDQWSAALLIEFIYNTTCVESLNSNYIMFGKYH